MLPKDNMSSTFSEATTSQAHTELHCFLLLKERVACSFKRPCLLLA